MTRMNRHACQCRLLLVALLLLPVTACRAQQRAPRQEIALRPAMEAIRESVVPRLHERVAEAGDDTGLAIMPAKPYAWHHAPTDDGATIDLTLKVDANDAYDRAVLTLWNWHNIPVHQQAVAGATSSDIRLRVHGYGTYLITLDAFAEDKCVYRLARSVSVAPDANLHQQAWNKGDYWLGICAFPGRFHWSNRGKPVLPEGLGEQEARELEARLIAQLGLSRVRLDVSMVMPENDKQAIDWKRMDASVAAWVGA